MKDLTLEEAKETAGGVLQYVLPAFVLGYEFGQIVGRELEIRYGE